MAAPKKVDGAGASFALAVQKQMKKPRRLPTKTRATSAPAGMDAVNSDRGKA